jgi:hypothetical protein
MRTTERPDNGHGRNDVNTRAVLLFGLWLAVGGVTVSLAMWGLFRALERKSRAGDRDLPPIVAASLARTPPEPRLEAYPLAPRQRLQAEEDGILTTYAWVDKQAGTVRIPIDRAMELLAERGLPPSKPMVPAAAPLPTADPAPTSVPGGQPR